MLLWWGWMHTQHPCLMKALKVEIQGIKYNSIHTNTSTYRKIQMALILRGQQSKVLVLHCRRRIGFPLNSSSSLNVSKERHFWGAWLAQSVKWTTSARVTISWFVGLNPTSGSGLIAQNLEPALDSMLPSLCPSAAHALCLSKINIKKYKERETHFLKLYLLIFERERERERVGEGQRKSERIPSSLPTVIAEFQAGLELTNHEIMIKVRHLTNWTTPAAQMRETLFATTTTANNQQQQPPPTKSKTKPKEQISIWVLICLWFI